MSVAEPLSRPSRAQDGVASKYFDILASAFLFLARAGRPCPGLYVGSAGRRPRNPFVEHSADVPQSQFTTCHTAHIAMLRARIRTLLPRNKRIDREVKLAATAQDRQRRALLCPAATPLLLAASLDAITFVPYTLQEPVPSEHRLPLGRFQRVFDLADQSLLHEAAVAPLLSPTPRASSSPSTSSSVTNPACPLNPA